MPNGEHQTDEFPLIRCQGAMTGRGRHAEESHRVLALKKDGPKAVRRGIALDDEGLGEVRQGEDGSRGDRRLEAVKAAAASGNQEKPSLRRRAERGAAITPNSWTNLR